MASLRVPYKTVDNIPIPTDIYLPPTSSPTPAPVLIMIHGGAFMLGSSSLNNADQIAACLARGWIVLAPEHRLCPGVDVLSGAMEDVRDVVAWAQTGGLGGVLRAAGGEGAVSPDEERVVVMGTSSGGHLALSTGWGTGGRRPPLAILDFYGAKGFESPFWTRPLAHMPARFHEPLPRGVSAAVEAEKTVLVGGMSLEGQAADAAADAEHPDSLRKQQQRQDYAMHHIATGRVLNAIWPRYPADLHLIDPLLNVHSAWPPTAFVHGDQDEMIPIELSREMEAKLREKGVRTAFFEVKGEGHTFAGKMVKGGETWVSQERGWEWLAERVRESYGPSDGEK